MEVKRVILVRHSNAEDPGAVISDFERSLTLRGKETSMAMARVLKTKHSGPGIIITSPAFRAYETAMIFARTMNVAPDEVRLCSDLYFKTNPEPFLSLLRSLDPGAGTVILFGHNPLISALGRFLSGDDTEELPKTGIISLLMPVSEWSAVSRSAGKTEFLLKPKALL